MNTKRHLYIPKNTVLKTDIQNKIQVNKSKQIIKIQKDSNVFYIDSKISSFVIFINADNKIIENFIVKSGISLVSYINDELYIIENFRQTKSSITNNMKMNGSKMILKESTKLELEDLLSNGSVILNNISSDDILIEFDSNCLFVINCIKIPGNTELSFEYLKLNELYFFVLI